MGLVYYNGKFVPEQNIQKSAAEAQVLRLLRSFLDANEPGLVRILVNYNQTQGKAVTYKELREAILNGDISPKVLLDWQQDYTQFVAKHLQPAWEQAIAVSVEELSRKYPTWYFDPMSDSVRSWTANHAAEFVTNVTSTQIEGLRAVVQRAAVLEDLSVDELSRVIRPCVGLTKPQATANLRYYERLRANGITPKRAREKAIRYATRQHRQRAFTLARTELCSAYSYGAHEGTKQAQAAGYLGEVEKVWVTAEDERTCSWCGALEGKQVGMDEEFDGISKTWSTRLHPPAHPGCRCAVLHIEKEPPEKER